MLIKYMLLRPFVNMYVSCWVFCMVLIAMSIALSMLIGYFGIYPGSLSDIWVLLLGLYTLEPAVLPFISPSGFLEGGINDTSVYIHYCG